MNYELCVIADLIRNPLKTYYQGIPRQARDDKSVKARDET